MDLNEYLNYLLDKIFPHFLIDRLYLGSKSLIGGSGREKIPSIHNAPNNFGEKRFASYNDILWLLENDPTLSRKKSCPASSLFLNI